MCLVDDKCNDLKIEYKEVTPKSVIVKQLLLTAGPFLLNIAKAFISAYSAILLPQLKQESSYIKTNIDEDTWIASAVIPSLALGCLLGGYISEKFGRKAAHTWTILPLTFSWLLVGFSQNVLTMIIGRFLAGLSSGVSGPANSMYICETCIPKYRGLLQTSLIVAMSLGILITHVLGTFLTWQTTAYICAGFTLLTWIPFFFVPESPDWLTKKNKAKEAKEAIKWIKGQDANVERVYEQLILAQSTQQLNHFTWREFFAKLKKPQVYKPFFIINFYLIIGQWSGNNMVCYYAVDIAKQSVGSNINEYLMVILIDIVRIISSFLSSYVSKNTPVRKLTFFSGYGCTFTLFGLALSIYYSSVLPSVIPFLFILGFIFLVTIGLVPIPWNLTGEMFPLKVRDTCSGLCMCVAYIAYFLLIKSGPYMFEAFGQVASYSIYAVVCLVGTVVLYYILPETYGKTLQEIESGFKKVPVEEKSKDALI